MCTYPILINIQQLSKKTKDDEIKELKDKTEKYDHEIILNFLQIGNGYYEKKYKILNKKKVLVIIIENVLGSGSTITTCTMSLINASIGIVLTSSTALFTSIAILITNEYISKLKIRSTNLRDWINVITLPYKRTLKTCMADKKVDEKEALDLRKIQNHYRDKRKETMKNISFRFETIFADKISKDSIPLEQIDKLNNFLAKII